MLTVAREETDGHRCCQTVSVLLFIHLPVRFSVSDEVPVERRGGGGGKEGEREREQTVCTGTVRHKQATKPMLNQTCNTPLS